jgi:hypothetical protein
MRSPGGASLDSCWDANAAKGANRIKAQRGRLAPILIIFCDCLGTHSLDWIRFRFAKFASWNRGVRRLRSTHAGPLRDSTMLKR